MKQVKNSFNLLSRLSNGFLLLAIILVIIPLLVIFVLGLYSLFFTEGYLLHFIGFLLFLSLLIFILHLFFKQKKREKEILLADEIIIEASPRCAEFDDEIRSKIYECIDKKVKEGIEWQNLQAYSLEVVSLIAFHYNPKNSEKELAFSVPELLLALEVISSKYRSIIIEYIPSFASKIQLSSLKQLYSHKDKVEMFGYAYDTYRLVRMLTPSGILSEVKSQITSKIFDDTSFAVQDKIKRALLKEMTNVAIELYRGGYKVKDSELNKSKISAEDKTNKAMNIEPLRVTLVGQVSAGKSSVINALIDKMVAEVSILPSTDKITVHECKIDGIDEIKLIDLPGLDGGLETEKIVIEQMTESDLILWVLKANLSARNLDKQLKKKFDEFYQETENRGKKRPTVIALLNQVDKLQPEKEWNPPYDLINCTVSDKKACTIRDAVKYNQDLLKPDDILVLSLNKNFEMYNIGSLTEYIQKAYDNGINTQFNRRRHEHSGDGMLESGKKMIKTGMKLFELE